MKVLFVLPEFGAAVPGGIARFYHHAITSLLQNGCEVAVCVSAQGVNETAAEGVRIFGPSEEQVRLHKQSLSHLALWPGLRHQLAVACAAFDACGGGRGFDVVETTDWGMLYVPWLAREPRIVPVVVQLHGSPGQIGFRDPLAGYEISDMLTRMLETALLPRADELQTPGPGVAAEWRNLLTREVRHLPPAWFSENEEINSTRADFGLVASRLQDWKGPEVLCKALEMLGDSAPEIRWAGRDHPRHALESSMSVYLAGKYPSVWQKKFVHLGGRSPADTKELQRSARFVIHPSTWDCFPLAAVEAMALGKVLICSQGAGVADLIEHGVNGYTFSSGDFQQLAALLMQVSQLDSESLTRIGREAQRTVNTILNADAITQERLKIYRGLRAAPREPHPWLERLFGPQRTGTDLRFLDAMPLRPLAQYGLRRLAHRLQEHWASRFSKFYRSKA